MKPQFLGFKILKHQKLVQTLTNKHYLIYLQAILYSPRKGLYKMYLTYSKTYYGKQIYHCLYKN